ncbi:retrovirus-related pol polyprotein from transposon TNT 1-94 [Tanacetum coccineum]
MTNLSKSAHSTVKWPIHKNTAIKNRILIRGNTIKDKNVNNVGPKAVVNVARPKPVVNDVKGNNVNVVKASACWVWKPKTKVLDHVSKHNSASITLKKFDYVDHKADPNYEEIDGGYVAFGGNPKGGKITSRDQRVKVIRCDNGTEFKNKEMNQFYERKGRKECDDAGKARIETVPGKDYILLPLWTADPPFSQSSKNSPDAGFKPSGDSEKKVTEKLGKEGGDPSKEDERDDREKDASVNSTNNVNAASINEVNVVGRKVSIKLPDEPNMPALEDIVYSDDDEDVGAQADMNNLDTFMPVSPIPTTRIGSQGHTKEGIDYDEVIAPVARIEAIRLFLAYASFKDFVVYQMDIKSAFLYGNIEEEVYVCQPPGFEDPDFPNKKEDGIFISQDKFVTEILKKFGFIAVKTASTPMETQKLLLKDKDGEEVDVHLYRSMIGSLMYLTSSA